VRFGVYVRELIEVGALCLGFPDFLLRPNVDRESKVAPIDS